jgi:DNA-directed RNA polymerase subunit RPC12/RpoP
MIYRGFALPCLKCGEQSALSLRLDSLAEDDAIHCPDCDADYSLADARAAVDAWSALLAWTDTAPALPVEGK